MMGFENVSEQGKPTPYDIGWKEGNRVAHAEIARLQAEVEWLRGTTGHTEDCPKAEAVVRAAETLMNRVEVVGLEIKPEVQALLDALAAFRERA